MDFILECEKLESQWPVMESYAKTTALLQASA
jgi:hypothetical protein